MNIIISQLPHCDRSPPEANSTTVRTLLLEQSHTITKNFRALKEHLTALDKSLDLFKHNPCLEATDMVLGNLFAMCLALDTTQATYEDCKTFRSGAANDSTHLLAQDAGASPSGDSMTTGGIKLIREFLAQGEEDVKIMKGMLLSRIRDIEGLKATYKHSQASEF
jgi:hypothetical protein